MREIKFRQLVRGSRFVGGSPDKPEIEQGGLMWHYFGFVNGGFASPVNYTDTATIGQFTGLHDKNGKEIYEGDILNVWDWGKPPNDLLGVVKVEWDETEKGWGFNPSMNIDRYDMFRNAEVIGNIHENPDLLKV